jgi:hypothetical protein
MAASENNRRRLLHAAPADAALREEPPAALFPRGQPVLRHHELARCARGPSTPLVPAPRHETLESEVDEELNVHLEMRVEELTSAGASVDAARREALRQFGDLEYTLRYCRQQDHEKEQRMQRGLMLGDLMQDLGICLRGLRRAPMMTMTIVATVGLGTAPRRSSAVNAALQPLPMQTGQFSHLHDGPSKFASRPTTRVVAQQAQFEEIARYRSGNTSRRHCNIV